MTEIILGYAGSWGRGFSLALVCGLCACAGAGTYTWTGLSPQNADGVGRWTDPANWTVDGASAVTPPGCYVTDGGSVTNGVVDDIAVFGPVPSGAATTIDLDGCVCIGGVQIAGAEAPAYTFGVNEEQVLRLDTKFTSLSDWRTGTVRANFLVSAEVTASPILRARCAVGYQLKHAATTTYAWGGLVNHAAVPLEISDFGYAYSADTTSGAMVPYVNFVFAGRGKINVNGVFATTTTCYPTHLENSDVTYRKSFTVGRIFTDGNSGPESLRLIEVPTGVEIFHNNAGFSSIHCSRAVRFYGGGTLRLTTSTNLEENGAPDDYRQFDCRVRVTGQANSADGRVLMAYSQGDYYYNCTSNDFPTGKFLLYNVNNRVDSKLMLGAPKFGLKGDDGNRPLGLINTVVAYGVGGIRFTGSVADTTDIDLMIGELTAVSSSYTWKHPQCEYMVAESGTAAFTVMSELIHGYVPTASSTAKAYCGTNTLHLTGDGTGGGVWNRALADGVTVAWGTTAAGAPVTLALRKTGTGTWTLPHPNTFTGETTLEAGKLDLGATGALASSPLVFKGGMLVVPAGRTVTVPSIRTAGGASHIELGAGATLTVVDYNDTGSGTVDVHPGAGARFVNQAAVGGSSVQPLKTLRCNDGEVFFDGTGKLVGSCGEVTTLIPVAGGVVPNNEPMARVGIQDGGTEGPITLAAPETVVTALTHVAEADGVVALNGQTLRLGQVNVGGTAGNLKIGNELGDGLLAPFPDDANKRIDFTVNNPDATVTVDAQIDGQTYRIYKYGSGNVVLNNAASMANIVYALGGALTFVTNIPARQFTISVQKSGRLSFIGDPADRRALSLLDSRVEAGNSATDEAVFHLENVAGGCLSKDKVITVGQGKNDATPPSMSRLELKNAQFCGGWTNEAPVAPCYVGRNYGSGTMTIEGDSIFGYAPTVGALARGAVYQLGGLLTYTNATWAGHLWLGANTRSWGYYALEDGLLDAQGSLTVATGESTCGILHQTGGAMVCRHLRNTTGIRGYGLVRHSGGTADYAFYYAPKSDANSRNLVSALVVDGGTVQIASLNLLAGTADDEAHVVLNGGSLSSPGISLAYAAGYGINGENNRAYLSFDGGVYRPDFGTYGGISLVNLSNALTRATVYSGGAVFDVEDGHELHVNQELLAPEGRGIAAVDWSGFPDVADDAFMGPPGVRILGDGEGAVAAAVYDRASGRVSGIEVLAPGVNYTWAKAEILYAAGAAARIGAITNACTLTAATPAAGPIVKRGAGTLRLLARNTVAGISLEEGLVRLASTAALPSPCTVAFKGGRIETFGGASLPAMNLRLAVGETATYPTAFAFPAGSSISIDGLENVRKEDHGYTLATFPGGVSNLPPVADELPAKWQVSMQGNTLRLSYIKGLAVTFR